MSTRLLALAAYISAVLAPNLLITQFGIVDLAPGDWVLMAPAGVFAVGVALVARDVLHEAAGDQWPVWVLGGIAAGAVLSATFADPRLVVASATAFLLSELSDLAVYAPLRSRGFLTAAAASSLVGAVIDSAVFLWLAFGSLAYLPGQVVGKTTAIAITVSMLFAAHQARSRVMA